MEASNPDRIDDSVATLLKLSGVTWGIVAVALAATCLFTAFDFSNLSWRLTDIAGKPVTSAQAIILVQCLSLALVMFLAGKSRREIRRRQAEERNLRDGMLQLALAASVDGLTGLSDSRAFDRRLNEEWKRALRSKSYLALVIVDVDRLSNYNDQKGNQRGDIVLKIVADCIQGSLKRSGDFVARFGGEEFAVLLPDTSPPGALVIAERIRAAVQAVGIAHVDTPDGVMTVSAGVASILPTHDVDFRDLIELADRALGAAKDGGRNRVFADQAAS